MTDYFRESIEANNYYMVYLHGVIPLLEIERKLDETGTEKSQGKWEDEYIFKTKDGWTQIGVFKGFVDLETRKLRLISEVGRGYENCGNMISIRLWRGTSLKFIDQLIVLIDELSQIFSFTIELLGMYPPLKNKEEISDIEQLKQRCQEAYDNYVEW